MGEHSPIGASSMYRWSVCPGSVRLSKGIKSVSSSYADEGTAAHEVAAKAVVSATGEIESDDDEVIEAVSVYVQTIQDDGHKNTGPEDYGTGVVYWQLVEHNFDLSSIYPGCFGTADFVRYFPRKKGLFVYDYKHGAGIAVEAKDNPQLKYYGLGALVSTKVPCDWVEMVIIQPRCSHPDGPVRRHRISTMELLEFAADLVEFAKATEAPDAPLKAGDHCRFCPAKGICPELQSKAVAMAKVEFAPSLSYDPAKLAEILHWLPALESWAKGVREFAYGEALHGRTPPGWKLAAKRATRKWKDNVDIASLAEATGLLQSEVFEKKIKSPAQVEKLLTAADRKLLDDLITSTSSGTSLVPDSDRREAVNKDPKTQFTEITAREVRAIK